MDPTVPSRRIPFQTRHPLWPRRELHVQDGPGELERHLLHVHREPLPHPRQFGVEDQGWLAWFVIAAVLGRTLVSSGET